MEETPLVCVQLRDSNFYITSEVKFENGCITLWDEEFDRPVCVQVDHIESITGHIRPYDDDQLDLFD